MYHQQDIFLLFIILYESLNFLNHHFWVYVFIDLNECFHSLFLYVFKHFFDSNFIILKLTSCRLAFNEIFLIQKSFFFNILLLSFILIQNISKSDHLFIVFMFLSIDSISSMLISFTHFTMFFIVIIMILLIFFFSLINILILNFLQWFCIDDAMLMLRTRWFSNDIINFSFILFAQLSTCLFFFANFFLSLLVIFFNLFN